MRNLREVKEANTRLGQTWFEDAENHFFRTTYPHQTLIQGQYFVTRDGDDSTPFQGWTIRKTDDLGQISTVGDFCGFDSYTEARKVAESLCKLPR